MRLASALALVACLAALPKDAETNSIANRTSNADEKRESDVGDIEHGKGTEADEDKDKPFLDYDWENTSNSDNDGETDNSENSEEYDFEDYEELSEETLDPEYRAALMQEREKVAAAKVEKEAEDKADIESQKIPENQVDNFTLPFVAHKKSGDKDCKLYEEQDQVVLSSSKFDSIFGVKSMLYDPLRSVSEAYGAFPIFAAKCTSCAKGNINCGDGMFSNFAISKVILNLNFPRVPNFTFFLPHSPFHANSKQKSPSSTL